MLHFVFVPTKRVNLLILIVFGLVWSFSSGYLLKQQNNLYPSPTPPTSTTPIPTTPIANTTPIPPRDDFAVTTYDIVAITTSEPKKVLYIERGIIESISFFFGYYFDGTTWHTSESSLNKLTVAENDSLYKYSNTIAAEIYFDDTVVTVSVPEIFTNMVIRSEHEYLKFGGSTTSVDTYVSIDNTKLPSQVGLLKRYKKTFNGTDISSLDVTTDWMMFWDENGNFYHLDKTDVGVPNDEYPPHEFFARTQYVGSEISGILYLPLNSINYTPAATNISYSESGQNRTLNLTHSSRYFGKLYKPTETTNTLITTKTGGIGVYTRFDTR